MKFITIWTPAVLVVLAVIFSLIFVGDYSYGDSLWRWLLFFSVGIQGIWAWYGQTFHAKAVAKSIGWENSPFLFEVACANLGCGIAGLLAPWMLFQYWLALSIVEGIFFAGAAYGHIKSMIKEKNFSPNNCGPIFFTDVLIPITFVILLITHFTL